MKKDNINKLLQKSIGKVVFVIVPMLRCSLSWHGELQYFKETNKYCISGNPSITFIEFDVASIEEQQFPIIRLTN
jgi:hypothetical protein